MPATREEIARDIVVSLVSSGKSPIDSDARETGRWLGNVYNAVLETINRDEGDQPRPKATGGVAPDSRPKF